MNLLGIPLLTHTPATCSNPYADCLNHGFGLSKERGRYIRETVYNHTLNCVDGAKQSIDYARYMAGPPTLELETPAEIFATGYLIAQHGELMRQAEHGALPEQRAAQAGLPPQVLEAIKRMTGADRIEVVGMGSTSPTDTGKYTYSGNGHDLLITLEAPVPTQLTTNTLIVNCTFKATEVSRDLKATIEAVKGVQAAYPDKYNIQVHIGKAFNPERVADEIAQVVLDIFKA